MGRRGVQEALFQATELDAEELCNAYTELNDPDRSTQTGLDMAVHLVLKLLAGAVV